MTSDRKDLEGEYNVIQYAREKMGIRANGNIPDNIGIITSPTGSVIKDMQQIIFERFSRKTLLYPVAVQGDKAVEEIVNAVKSFNNQNNLNKPSRQFKINTKINKFIHLVLVRYKNIFHISSVGNIISAMYYIAL